MAVNEDDTVSKNNAPPDLGAVVLSAAPPVHADSVRAQGPRTASAEPEAMALVRHALKVCPLMNRWPESVLDQLARIASLHRYDKDSPLTEAMRSRREAIVVVAGRLLVEGVDAQGGRHVLALHGPGEIVGLVRLLEHVQFMYFFQVAQDTVLVHLPADPLMAVLDAHPMLWRDVSLLLMSRLHDLIARQQRRATGDMSRQVADMLLRLTPSIGKSGEGGVPVHLRLAQGDLAAMLGITRQTLSKELVRLQHAGVIAMGYGRLDLLDLQALRQRAG